MKKLLALGLLTLAALGCTTSSASAWWPCFGGCGKCCNKCCTTICLSQYNAFTPICCGNLSCNGCCPMTFGGCCPTNCGQGCCPSDGGSCMMNPSFGGASCMGQLPYMNAPMNMEGANFQSMPNATSMMPSMQQWNGYMPVQPAAYGMSGYNMPNSNMGAMPWYWGANGQ